MTLLRRTDGDPSMSSCPSVQRGEVTRVVSPFWEARKSCPMSVGQEIRLDGWTRLHRYVRVRPTGKQLRRLGLDRTEWRKADGGIANAACRSAGSPAAGTA
jgi:hypothetical protein